MEVISMNLKRLTIISLIMLSLILCISAVSAVENGNVTPIEDGNQNVNSDANQDTNINTNQNTNNVKENTQTQTAPKKTTKPIRTDVDADDVVVTYKKKGYFKVKVENDDTDRPVKNLKLKVKVFTKSKSKTYTIKTNSYGIAKLNTHKLKIGIHKVIVTSTDSKYKINKHAKIHVGKKSTVTIKPGQTKKINSKNKIKLRTYWDDDDKEVKVIFKGSSKYAKLLKAKFYFKDKYTGRVMVKTDYAEYDDDTGRWEFPEEDCSYRFTPMKVKVTYVTYK